MSLSSNISPCSRLNVDVLREIFIHCIIHTEHPHTDYYSKDISSCFVVDACHKVLTRNFPQLSISRVCYLWRDTALRTRQLWDHICISGKLMEADFSIAREYLSRARDLPVSIAIRPCTEGMPGKYLRSLLIDFLSTVRIRILKFHYPPFLMVLPDLPPWSVAELESLVIYGKHNEEKTLTVDLDDTRYPKLTLFRTNRVRHMSSFNCRSLRIFDGWELSLTVIESWDLLSHCQSLEESRLWIKRVFDGNWGPVSMPQIHHQHLRKLSLRSESEIPFSLFIEALSLPLLEKLSLLDVATWSMPAFQSLAHRSNDFPHLRKFHLAHSTSIIDAGILLASMPWLKSIFIGANTSNVVFDDFALQGLASGSLTPQLQSIRVGSISNASLFVDMLESRMKNAQMSSNGVPALLTEVYLSDYHSCNEWYRRRDMLLERGVPVKEMGD